MYANKVVANERRIPNTWDFSSQLKFLSNSLKPSMFGNVAFIDENQLNTLLRAMITDTRYSKHNFDELSNFINNNQISLTFSSKNLLQQAQEKFYPFSNYLQSDTPSHLLPISNHNEISHSAAKSCEIQPNHSPTTNSLQLSLTNTEILSEEKSLIQTIRLNGEIIGQGAQARVYKYDGLVYKILFKKVKSDIAPQKKANSYVEIHNYILKECFKDFGSPLKYLATVHSSSERVVVMPYIEGRNLDSPKWWANVDFEDHKKKKYDYLNEFNPEHEYTDKEYYIILSKELEKINVYIADLYADDNVKLITLKNEITGKNEYYPVVIDVGFADTYASEYENIIFSMENSVLQGDELAGPQLLPF